MDSCGTWTSHLFKHIALTALATLMGVWHMGQIASAMRLSRDRYELFCFEDQAAFSPWSGSTMDLQLMVQSLQHKDLDDSNIVSEVRQLAKWWWPYLKEKIRVMRQVKYYAAKLGMGKRLVLGFREQSVKLFRTQVTVFDDPPSMPIFNPTSRN